ncbi:uncharacterized protein LOC143930920 isoform X2 [Lithobates pipiens]
MSKEISVFDLFPSCDHSLGHHTVIFPSELRSDQSEEVCIQLEGAQGESRVEILLNVEDKNTTLAEKTFQDSTFTCIKIQVPDFKTEEQSVVATLVAVIENAGETIKKSAKVLLKKAKSGRLIQTDRAVYKPGQKASSSVDEPTTTLTEGRGAKKEEEERVQSYFPETFPFGDLAVGMGGSAELQMKAPDTITDCNGGAVCLGPTRFARSSPTSLRVFQPFSVDVTLPSSVVQGEPFILTASIFNYMQDPMKIQSTLNSDIEEMPCEECHHSSCIGADESKTFSWIINLVSLDKMDPFNNANFMGLFIELYMEMPCLWQFHNTFYNDRSKRNAALEKLLSLVRIVVPMADMTYLNRKIVAMKMTYLRERKKYLESLRAGDTDAVYYPRMVHFDRLHFLVDQGVPRPPLRPPLSRLPPRHPSPPAEASDVQPGPSRQHHVVGPSLRQDDLSRGEAVASGSQEVHQCPPPPAPATGAQPQPGRMPGGKSQRKTRE